MAEMLIQTGLLSLVHVVLPGFFIYALWRGREQSRLMWIVKAAYSSAFVLYIVLAGRWDWLSTHLRFVWLALLAMGLIAAGRRVHSLPWFGEHTLKAWMNLASGSIAVLVFVVLLVFVLRGRVWDDDAVALVFPLQAGSYYIVQGGSNSLLNHHHGIRSQQHALDIVEIDAAGVRASGLFPSNVERYRIFGETVYSPCDGRVARAVDDLPDQRPPQKDRQNPAGNFVVIACAEVDVLLAHLQEGSVRVSSGESVAAGVPVGRVGNSGNTSEPHLHIHAVRRTREEDVLSGEGVPLLFEGRYPVRNSVIVR